MRQKWSFVLKILLILGLIVPLMASCGGINQTIQQSYPLESVNGSGNAASYVYRAADTTVMEAAQELIAKQTPQQQSPAANDRMFLVYADRIVHIQQDEQLPSDTLIEVSSREYVRNNYSMSFLQGYLLASLLDDLFDYGRYKGGSYRGYTQRDVYKPSAGGYRAPTAREKKALPPITVQKQGSVYRRGGNAGTTTRPGSGGNVFEREPSRPGTITRDGSGGQPSNDWITPRKSKVPRTKSGYGRVRRRR
ncbi:DUF4247 domain-containing protein [Paenibacillus methanolicus]|uniref:Uncharacterized protein DUF4247 n=1 Tax=Paenibacillus methanolicus TaxID=582686 RepID=A0A5S5BZX6_9BACL|nr:DUF4247 domain-containing protein [Paenibacillus methanolicus]TYP72735.1 uncharacterized protein DUF4247 [Paenibacillus methanolicus]